MNRIDKCMDCGKKSEIFGRNRCKKCYMVFYNKELYSKDGKSKNIKFCLSCGKSIKNLSPITKYCSDKCRIFFQHHHMSYKEYEKIKLNKKCLICNKLFKAETPREKYCSNNCNQKAWWIRYLKRNRKRANKWAKTNYPKHREKILKRGKKWREENKELVSKRNKGYRDLYREIENERRKRLNLPLVGEGFKKEMELLYYIKRLFIGYKIVIHDRNRLHFGKRNFLELDIYLPELKLAFEYMGEQHYSKEVFERWFKRKDRIEETFEALKYRDKIKKRLCKENGITLIKIKYNEKLSEQLILSKIKYINVPIEQKEVRCFE